MTTTAETFRIRIRSRGAQKLLLWLLLSAGLSVVFFREFWTALPDMLTFRWIFVQHHAASWGVLALCVGFAWLKRREIGNEMGRGESAAVAVGGRRGLAEATVVVLLGAALVVAAVRMPAGQVFIIFRVLLASLGVFVALFGRGARIPAILVGLYGMAMFLPAAVERFAAMPIARTVLSPLMALLTALGYPVQNQGIAVQLLSTTGETIRVRVTYECAGPSTMGVFLAIFALMMMDMPLPRSRAGKLLLFGVVGTWFQSFIRLVILMLAGYYWGANALWTAHSWTIYILFPLWYLLFAYVYFREAGKAGIGVLSRGRT